MSGPDPQARWMCSQCGCRQTYESSPDGFCEDCGADNRRAPDGRCARCGMYPGEGCTCRLTAAEALDAALPPKETP